MESAGSGRRGGTSSGGPASRGSIPSCLHVAKAVGRDSEAGERRRETKMVQNLEVRCRRTACPIDVCGRTYL